MSGAMLVGLALTTMGLVALGFGVTPGGWVLALGLLVVVVELFD